MTKQMPLKPTSLFPQAQTPLFLMPKQNLKLRAWFSWNHSCCSWTHPSSLPPSTSHLAGAWGRNQTRWACGGQVGAQSLQSTTGPLTGAKVSLGEKPFACKGHAQPFQGVFLQLPTTQTGKRDPWTFARQQSPLIHQVSLSPFSHRVPVAEGRHQVFWVLHGAAGSAQLQTCKIGTISFGNKLKRNCGSSKTILDRDWYAFLSL